MSMYHRFTRFSFSPMAWVSECMSGILSLWVDGHPFCVPAYAVSKSLVLIAFK